MHDLSGLPSCEFGRRNSLFFVWQGHAKFNSIKTVFISSLCSGFILQAPWNHFYYQLLDGALPPTDDPFTATTGIKVAIDQFIQAPIFTVIIFGFLGVLEGKSIDEIKKQLDDDYVDTMFANWKLWVPATAVNIAFCPPLLRVLFLNVVFFFWSIFLSLKLNKTEDVNEI